MSSRTCVGTTDVPPPVKNNTDRMNQVVRKRLLWGEALWDGGTCTCIGTTDIPPPVKNNTDRMNQLVW